MAFWSERCRVLGSSPSLALPDLVVFGTTPPVPPRRAASPLSIPRRAAGRDPTGALLCESFAVRVIGGGGRTSPGVTPPPEASRPDVDTHLTELFRAYSPRVYAYARRHVDLSACDDVVSETFLVAWRRPDAVPDPALPWLLVVARNVIANQRRTSRRADLVWFAAVREGWATTAPSADEALQEREGVLRALERCTRAEREALLLTAWDGLRPSEAAAVADCSVRAFTVRLHRARSRLRAAMAQQDLETRRGTSAQLTAPAAEPAHVTTRLAQEHP